MDKTLHCLWLASTREREREREKERERERERIINEKKRERAA